MSRLYVETSTSDPKTYFLDLKYRYPRLKRIDIANLNVNFVIVTFLIQVFDDKLGDLDLTFEGKEEERNKIYKLVSQHYKNIKEDFHVYIKVPYLEDIEITNDNGRIIDMDKSKKEMILNIKHIDIYQIRNMFVLYPYLKYIDIQDCLIYDIYTIYQLINIGVRNLFGKFVGMDKEENYNLLLMYLKVYRGNFNIDIRFGNKRLKIKHES